MPKPDLTNRLQQAQERKATAEADGKSAKRIARIQERIERIQVRIDASK